MEIKEMSVNQCTFCNMSHDDCQVTRSRFKKPTLNHMPIRSRRLLFKALREAFPLDFSIASWNKKKHMSPKFMNIWPSKFSRLKCVYNLHENMFSVYASTSKSVLTSTRNLTPFSNLPIWVNSHCDFGTRALRNFSSNVSLASAP